MPSSPPLIDAGPQAYELRFQSLFKSGRALAFPCDARGDVLLDQLSERGRENYLFARAVVGREYASPVVQALGADRDRGH